MTNKMAGFLFKPTMRLHIHSPNQTKSPPTLCSYPYRTTPVSTTSDTLDLRVRTLSDSAPIHSPQITPNVITHNPPNEFSNFPYPTEVAKALANVTNREQMLACLNQLRNVSFSQHLSSIQSLLNRVIDTWSIDNRYRAS